jgi:hypothetical protein
VAQLSTGGPAQFSSDGYSLSQMNRKEVSAQRQDRLQTIAKQRGRISDSGGKPGEAEIAQMLADFHEKGGRATQVPPSDDVLPEAGNKEPRRHQDNGASGIHVQPAKRALS